MPWCIGRSPACKWGRLFHKTWRRPGSAPQFPNFTPARISERGRIEPRRATKRRAKTNNVLASPIRNIV